jgi:ATP synthase F1 complex assembly factor 2
LAKSIRASFDPTLQEFMKEELYSILENDQICFRESEEAENEYKTGLAKAQKEHTQKIFDILEKDFGIKLKVFHNIQMEPQDSSVTKLLPMLSTFDNFVLFSLYSVAISAKSTAIALSFLLRDHISIEEAVAIARVDENYQSKHFGRVEGAHDLDEAGSLTTFASAKNLINLC